MSESQSELKPKSEFQSELESKPELDVQPLEPGYYDCGICDSIQWHSLYGECLACDRCEEMRGDCSHYPDGVYCW